MESRGSTVIIFPLTRITSPDSADGLADACAAEGRVGTAVAKPKMTEQKMTNVESRSEEIFIFHPGVGLAKSITDRRTRKCGALRCDATAGNVQYSLFGRG